MTTGNRTLLQNEAFMSLFMEARSRCFRKVLSKPYPSDGRLYCNATMDLFGCWNFTLAGKRSVISCPDHLPGFNTKEFAYKDCTENGTWWLHPETGKSHAFYDSCRNFNSSELDDENHHLHVYIFIAGYSISLIMLLISIFIFFKFRQLRCDRITIHKNLFISYIITGVSWIIYFLLVVLNGHVLIENPVWCQALHVVTQYSVASNFAWMFCEGLYLHTVMMKAFTSGKWIIVTCYVTGWVIPALLTGVYTTVRAMDITENKYCWLHESKLQWITYAPIVLSMIMNFFFLCNIVRLLITKLRQIPEAAQTRKAARATLILIPLLGLQLLLFPMRPQRDSVLLDVYTYAVAIVTSLQGSFVSFIYCFCNGEVRKLRKLRDGTSVNYWLTVLCLLKRKWNQHKQKLGQKKSRAQSSIVTSYIIMDQPSSIQSSVVEATTL